jgi:intein/homing endonuclease
MTKKPTPISERDVVYLAGLFDGEGCLSVYGYPGIAHKGETKRGRISYKAAVQMTHYEVLH